MLAKTKKEVVKKYKYLFSGKLRNIVNTSSKRILSIYADPTEIVKSGINASRLPYPVKWEKLVNYNELYLEIGCGTGDLIKYLSGKNPESLYVGYEITRLYTKQSDRAVSGHRNAYVFNGDGYDASLNHFSKQSLAGIYVLFPDPWHKKSHHKRRPIVNTWMRNVSKKLKSEGFIFIATDWMKYVDFILEQTNLVKDLYSVESGKYNPTDHGLTDTYYYRKWSKIGREFKFIRLQKK